MVYDATSQEWIVTVVDSTPEIDELLSADAPDSYTISNDAPGTGFPLTTFINADNTWSDFSYVVDSAFVVNPGETMTIRLICGDWCGEMDVEVNGFLWVERNIHIWLGTYNIVDRFYGDGPNGGQIMLIKKHHKMQHL